MSTPPTTHPPQRLPVDRVMPEEDVTSSLPPQQPFDMFQTQVCSV